jgi:hypothetical protein
MLKPRILVVEDDHPAPLTVLPSVPNLIGGHLMVGESPSISASLPPPTRS